MTARERLRMHLKQAFTRAESPDVRAHLRAAIRECDDLPLTPLAECPVCERVGLPERILDHECQKRSEGWRS
jgi:hypothetical protein